MYFNHGFNPYRGRGSRRHPRRGFGRRGGFIVPIVLPGPFPFVFVL